MAADLIRNFSESLEENLSFSNISPNLIALLVGEWPYEPSHSNTEADFMRLHFLMQSHIFC